MKLEEQMGVPKLKKKVELNYRRGYTSRSCNDCNHFVELRTADLSNTGEYRCKIIGLNPGRQYRIHPANICDAHDNSRYLARLKGESYSPFSDPMNPPGTNRKSEANHA